jgi:hypothetical protein
MTKRYAISVFLSLAFLLLVVPAATCSGDEGLPPDGGFAACHVFVDVDPNIAIMPLGPVIDMGSIQTGVFTGTIPFRIDANTEQVRIWTAATLLWKGDVHGPLSEIPPIGFERNSGVEIYAETGSPVGGADNRAEFIGSYPIGDYPGYQTERIVFESSQNGHFSQRVDMVVHWDQTDPEKPMGEYSGKVKMLAEVVLPAP